MNAKAEFNSLLVPVDFSEASEEAFQRALHLAGGDESSIIVLHVIDESLIEMMSDNEFGNRDELTSNLRDRAERRLSEFTKAKHLGNQVTMIVSVGVPFVEVIRKSDDFDVDAIVMGKVGAGDQFEKLLFGSTAERVLRASMRPVIVFPKPANRSDSDA